MGSETIMGAPPLAIGTFASGTEASAFPGLVIGERVVDLRNQFGAGVSTTSLLVDWTPSLDRLRAIADGEPEGEHLLADLQLRVPFKPRQILCAGANYHKHVVEMASAGIARERPKLSAHQVREIAEQEANGLAAGDPFLFAGLPTALCSATDDIVLWGGALAHDWELELAVVIGEGGRDISAERAMEHVAGYTIANDITTRDVIARGPMPYSDLLAGKSRPTFFPVGPYLVPRALIPEPRDLRITLRLNGEVMQDGSTSDLIHGVDKLVSYASRLVGLYPGDLLLTGSPSGNAAHHGNRWLTPGDLIESEITGLGWQRNRCVADPSVSGSLH